MPSFVRIDLRTKLACQSGALIGTLYPHQLLHANDIHAVEEQESLSFSCARVDRSGQTWGFLSSLVAGHIASVVWSDGTFDEWRISTVEDGQNAGEAVTITANPLMLDLTSAADSSTGRGFVSSVTSGLRIFSFTALDNDATDLWDNYIIPACPSWVSRGTITPTTVIPELSWDRQTPAALALMVRDTLRLKGETCELQLRRNGTSGYYLDLITAIGGTAAVPVFHPRTSLHSLKRKFDATQQATRLFVAGANDPSEVPGILGHARWKVGTVNTGAKTVELLDPAGGTGPIGFTNQWAGVYLLRVKSGRTFLISSSAADTNIVTLSETPTMVADETVEFRLTEPGDNTRTSGGTRYDITAIAGSDITMAGNPITADDQFKDWYARIWDNSVGGSVIRDTRISASVAASDVVTVASVAGVTTSHYAEFIQLDGAGEIPSYIEHPTYVQAPLTGYGVRVADLTVDRAVGVAQIVGNGWMRTYTNPASVADGWTKSGTWSRNASATYTRYGGYSAYSDFFPSSTLQTPASYVPIAPGLNRLSVRAQLKFQAFSSAGGDVSFFMIVYALTATGALGTNLGQTVIIPTDTSGTGGTRVAVDTWTTMEITGVDLSTTQTPYGFVVGFSASGMTNTGYVQVYIDTVEGYCFTANPEDIFEFGDAVVLHQAGNAYLETNGAPLVSYEVSIADLERSDPAVWSRAAITHGGNVRVVDAEFSVDQTVRLLKLERDLLRPQASQLSLSNRPSLLTSLVTPT